MVRSLSVLFIFVCSNVCAKDALLREGVNWLKGSLPEGTEVTFNKSRLKFDGCKHREYELAINQPFSENFSVEALVTHAKGQLVWGTYQQSVSVKKYSFIPRYQVSENVSLGAGMVYQSSPEFKTSQGFDINLPKSQMFLVSSRFQGLRNNHHIELEFSSTKYSATDTAGNWFERGAADNKFTVSYEASF